MLGCILIIYSCSQLIVNKDYNSITPREVAIQQKGGEIIHSEKDKQKTPPIERSLKLLVLNDYSFSNHFFFYDNRKQINTRNQITRIPFECFVGVEFNIVYGPTR